MALKRKGNVAGPDCSGECVIRSGKGQQGDFHEVSGDFGGPTAGPCGGSTKSRMMALEAHPRSQIWVMPEGHAVTKRVTHFYGTWQAPQVRRHQHGDPGVTRADLGHRARLEPQQPGV